MPNQPAATKQAATFRFDRVALRRAQGKAQECGESLTAVLERALVAYAPEPVTTPPAEGQPDQ